MAASIERIIEQIKALPPEEKSELARRLDETGLFDDDQNWYWAPEWQAGEREAEEDIATGRVKRFEDVEGAIRYLRQQFRTNNT